MAEISPHIASILAQGKNVRDKGDINQAVTTYQFAVTEAKQLNDKVGEATALLRLGVVYRASIQDLTQARGFLQESLRICEDIGSDQAQASVMCELGSVAFQEGHYAEGLEWHTTALNIFRQYDNKLGEATVLHQMGLIEKRQGDFDSAERHIRESLHLFETANDEASIGQVLLSLTSIAVNQRDYEQGRRLSNQALAIFEKLGLSQGILKAKNNLAFIEKQK